MKAVTLSLLTLGLAVATGTSSDDVQGDHGSQESPTRTAVVPAETTVDVGRVPLGEMPCVTFCQPMTAPCCGAVCLSGQPPSRMPNAEGVAAALHQLALILSEEIDFDLHETREFPHLMRDADVVVRDVIAVRRSIAARGEPEAVSSDVRNAAESLQHLDRAIGRHYRTRAIHFALLDTQAALDDLTATLGVGPRQDANEQGLPLTAPPPTTDNPATGGQPAARTAPQSATPPGPPALRSDPAIPSANPEVLVIPEPVEQLTVPDTMNGLRQLSQTDQRLAMKQRTCPITGDLLGSMGKPIKVNVDGRTVFVCCQGCVKSVSQADRGSL